MHYEMTLYIAEGKINDFMKMADVTPQPIAFETTSIVDEAYIYNLIEVSKESNLLGLGTWIPAITFCGKTYVDKQVKELSDGQRVGFICN